MAMRVHGWIESKAHTHLHKRGRQWHKSCAFLSVGILVLSWPDPHVHLVLLLTAVLEEDETEKFNYMYQK